MGRSAQADGSAVASSAAELFKAPLSGIKDGIISKKVKLGGGTVESCHKLTDKAALDGCALSGAQAACR